MGEVCTNSIMVCAIHRLQQPKSISVDSLSSTCSILWWKGALCCVQPAKLQTASLKETTTLTAHKVATTTACECTACTYIETRQWLWTLGPVVHLTTASTRQTHSALLPVASIPIGVGAVHWSVRHSDDPGVLGTLFWRSCHLNTGRWTYAVVLECCIPVVVVSQACGAQSSKDHLGSPIELSQRLNIMQFSFCSTVHTLEIVLFQDCVMQMKLLHTVCTWYSGTCLVP